jgi:hypothetical protein
MIVCPQGQTELGLRFDPPGADPPSLSEAGRRGHLISGPIPKGYRTFCKGVLMVSGVIALALFVIGPQGPEAPQRFKMDFTMKQSADLSAMGMGEQVSEVNASVWYTLTMSDTTGGFLAHAVIDSMKIGNATGQMGAQINQTLADSLAGEFVHAYIVNGKVEGTPTPSAPTNPAMNLAAPVIGVLFPGIRGGVKSWSDTVATSTDTPDGGAMNSQSITDWKAEMDGDVVMATATAAGTVSGSQNGQDISGEVTNSWSISSVAGGPAMTATMESQQNLTVIIMQAPGPIAVVVNTSATLEAIP